MHTHKSFFLLFFSIIAIALISIFADHTARANELNNQPFDNDLQICNQSSFILEVSIGAKSENLKESRGWYRTYPGFCKVINFTTLEPDSEFFLLAKNSYVYEKSVTEYAGDEIFCVSNNETDTKYYFNNIRDCRREGDETKGFVAFSNENTSSFANSIILFGKERYRNRTAKFAALQRLLQLAGFYNQKIDGLAGKGTVAAMRRFANFNNVSLPKPYSPPQELFDVLIDYVSDIQNKKGVNVCNSTNSLVWFSLGTQVRNRITTKGWFKLDSKDCTKVIREIDANTQLYLFAESSKQTGNQRTQHLSFKWSGNELLCTRSTKFILSDKKNCEMPRYSLLGFRKINITKPVGKPLQIILNAENSDGYLLNNN